jgi:SAM-dependent methyltransferase
VPTPVARVPLPPAALMRRVGWDIYAPHPADVFEERGHEQWRLIKSLLPDDWSFEGKRILDFGCGVGRVLRPAVAEDPEGEFWGCDIHAPSVEWLRAHLSPPVHISQTGEWPPVQLADRHFDLIYAFSVFTHLVDSWGAWLLELHRVLKDDGVLIATVFGPGQHAIAKEPIAEDIIGMNVLSPSASWDVGGPLIVHSEWWLRAHWGRAFEILELRSGEPYGLPPLFGQGVVVMRKRPVALTTEDLERPAPGEPRELAALRQNVASLRREVASHTVYLTSRSWRLTAPLRTMARILRKRLGRPTRGPSQGGS